jgi:hypothetical protein
MQRNVTGETGALNRCGTADDRGLAADPMPREEPQVLTESGTHLPHVRIIRMAALYSTGAS